MKKLENQVVLVTGGNRGIGEAILRHLICEGAILAFTYRSGKERAQEIGDELIKVGEAGLKPVQNPFMLQMDVSQEASVLEGVGRVLERFGRIDGLVNNAGITKDQLLLRMSEEDFNSVIDTNLKGSFLCTKAVLKPMMRMKKGSIVSITSVIGQAGNSGQSNYSASKAGIEAFTKSVAREVGSRKIRLNCVAPGYIETDMTDRLTEEQKHEILFNRVPLKRLGVPQDVAYAVSFLLSQESSYITGQTLNVNGGMYM